MTGQKISAHSFGKSLFIAALMVLAAAASAIIRPVTDQDFTAPDLEARLPESFAGWRRMPLGEAVLPAELDLGPGEAVAYRAYRDDLGRVVTLVAAYGPPLGDSVRLHRPERCYVAQGFTIHERVVAAINTHKGAAPVVQLLTQSPTRREAVSYWLRSGPAFVTAAPSGQLINFTRGFARPLDGALIRVSSPGGDPSLLDLHTEFLSAFAGALDEKSTALFLGGAQPAGGANG